MLQPKFNPFFYGKFVFGLSRAPESGSESVSTNVEGGYHESVSKAKTGMQSYMNKKKEEFESKITENSKDVGFGTHAWRRALKMKSEIAKKINDEYNNLGKYLDGADVKSANDAQRKELITRKLNEIKKAVDSLNGKIDEFFETEKKRKEMITALEKNKTELKSYFKNFFDKNLDDEQKGKVVWADLDKLIDAYMDRFVKENTSAINTLADDKIKLLHSDLSGGIFARGLLHKDVEEIKGAVHKIITDYWLTGKEREVYKNDYWAKMDKNWIGRPGDDLYAGRKDPYFKEKKETGMVPFPDGKDFAPGKGKKPYESPLKAENLKGLETDRTKEMQTILAERTKLIADFKKLGGKAEDLEKYRNQRVGGYPLSLVLMEDNFGPDKQKPEYMPVIKKAIAILKEVIAGKEKKEPIVKDITVDEKGIHVIGENLTSTQSALGIDPNYAFVDLKTGIEAGSGTAEISGNIKKIDTNILAMLKNALSEAARIAQKHGAGDLIEKIVSPDKLKKIKEIFLDKQKPKIVVWGVASMEGGFDVNKKIAINRANSAAAKLRAENPGVKIETRWAIQGLDDKITSLAELKKNEEKMVKFWNEHVNPDKKVSGINEIYAKLKNQSSWNEAENKFFKERFLDARKVAMALEFNQSNGNLQIAMNFENKPATTPAQPSSTEGPQLASR